MVTAIIQARMNSSRLPGKIFCKIGEKSVLEHVIFQTLCAKTIDQVIIATTRSIEDKVIVKFCKKNNIDFFCGSKNNVLDRYYQCAKQFNCNPIVRISSDSPFVDPLVIDKVVNKFLNNYYDYVSNNIEKKSIWKNSPCNFPIGTVVEICSFKCLEKAWNGATLNSEKEHVFPYVQFNPKQFKISNIKHFRNLSHIRTTIDYFNDLKFDNELYKRIKTKNFISTTQIAKIISEEPSLLEINNNTKFDEGYKKSLLKDNSKPNIIFRVDGNQQLGMGHVYRVMNIAKKLQKNYSLLFVTKTLIAKKMLSPFGNCILFRKNDSKFLKSSIKNFNPDIIIVDKLFENQTLLNFFKLHTKKLIGIDYTSKNFSKFDISLNMLYSKSGSKSKKNYSGFKYSIINNNFYNFNPITINKKINSILILQGGSDTHCFIPKIIDALNLIDLSFSLTVVTGPSFQCWTELNKSIKQNKKNITVLKNVKNMASIMSKSDFAISAGGITLLELTHLGIPTIVVCAEKFENETANTLEKLGFGKNLGFGKSISKNFIAKHTLELIRNTSSRKSMNSIGPKIIDSKSTSRIVKIIDSLI
jgi:spore coat polysaccharide biosynthesis protein SpsF